jgi:DnaJ-class molecular chaperone
MKKFLRAIRANCDQCWGHGGYTYQGHWLRCRACGGTGNAS